jgi:hypothetical protein
MMERVEQMRLVGVEWGAGRSSPASEFWIVHSEFRLSTLGVSA